MSQIFKGKVYLLVTGASRGIGKQIVETFVSYLENGSVVSLLARSAENLKNIVTPLPKNIIASYESVDFSNTNTERLQEIVTKSLKNENPKHFDQAIIVHCAAMAKFSHLTTELIDFEEWHRNYHLNVFSPAVLNGIFMKVFDNHSTKKFVVNISSYWGIKPDEYVGSYCSAKAAKDMFFKVFALENPNVNVLNYLPGFVETDMLYNTLKSTKNEKLKNKIKNSIEQKTVVTPAATAAYLVEILKEQKYKSGDHVDYYKKF